MPTSGPGGVSTAKGLFRWSPFPAEKVVVFAPARFWRCYRWKGEKICFGCVSCLPFPGPSFIHRPRSPLPPKINLLPIFLAFEPQWNLVVKFMLRGGFWDVWPVFVASIVYLSSFRHWRDAQPSPMQECGQRPKSCCCSSPMYPTGIRKSICLQNNKTESLQNSTSVKQQNSVSTQQRNSKTVTSVSQYFSQSVLQSVSAEFSQYWRQSVSLPFWIRRLRTFLFLSILFPMSASGTGGSPLQIGRRTSGNGTWYSTRFWVPGTWYVSGLGKLCFPLREIDFVTENSLPARGWKTPPKSSFFTGATVPRAEI